MRSSSAQRMHSSVWPRFTAPSNHRPRPGWQLGTGTVGSRLPLRVRKFVWQRITMPFRVRWREGLRVWLYPANETSASIFLTGIYDPNEFHVLDRVLETDMTFIDVGANMGLYSMFAARKVGSGGTIVSIEPSTRDRERLAANVHENALENVWVTPFAASNFQGTAELLIAQDFYSGHNTLGNFGYDGIGQIGVETVAVMTLDEILNVAEIKDVHVVKFDVEGAEVCALQGASETLATHHPMLLLEISDRSLSKQGTNGAELIAILQHLGYTLYSLDSRNGLPQRQVPRDYYDSENIIALHPLSKIKWPF